MQANLVDGGEDPLELPENRGTAARGRTQRHQHQATRGERARVSLHRAQRVAQATQHFIEDHHIERLRGQIVLAVRDEKSTARAPLLLRYGDCARRDIESDIPGIGIARKPAQQQSLATAAIQHRSARLQVAYIACEYAEARELGKLRQEVPSSCGVLRFPGLRGLQKTIGAPTAIQDRLPAAQCLLEERARTDAWSAHDGASVLSETAGTILRSMSMLPILCYHNVAAAPSDARFKLLYVAPEKFERQLWTLRRLGLRGVSTSEGIARLRQGTARGCVVFTFDDGYADALTTAAPLLKRYGFQATCYVVSGAVGTYNRWDAEFLQERKPLMNREQLDQWLAAGMEVGSHSVSHQRLQEAPRNVALDEIAESRAALRHTLGVPIDHFAYPFGWVTADLVELVERAGYASAVTVLPGVARASDDPLRLPRVLVNGERGLWRFLLHVATPYERLRLKRRAL